MLDTSTGEFQVTLSKPLQHNVDGVEDDLNFNVGYTVTDSDGDTADGQLNVVIDDDVPVAAPDTATTPYDSAVTIDVLGNDSLGADGGDITGATVVGGADTGTVTINPGGTLTFTPAEDFSGNAVIEYQVTDEDGDTITSTATVTTEVPDELSVGDNTDNVNGTNDGNDVLIGDLGGTNTIIKPAQNYNIAIVLDSSNTMGPAHPTASGQTRLDIARAALKTFAEQLADHTGTINLRIVDFNRTATSKDFLSFDGSDLGAWGSHLDAINVAFGTNTEAGIRDAIDFFETESRDDFENLTYLVTDGVPTFFLRNDDSVGGPGNEPTTQTVNQAIFAAEDLAEYSVLEGISVEPFANGATILSMLDNTNVSGTATINVSGGSVTHATGEIVNITTSGELEAALQTGSSTEVNLPVGDDILTGGAGDDIIIGDKINSDGLSWTNGDTGETFGANSHNGLGYEGLIEFLKWSENEGAEPSDQQIIEYIRDNAFAIRDIGGLDGGNDILSGEAGDDILFGDAGDDVLIGGAGSDTMIGARGGDTFVWQVGHSGTDSSPDSDKVLAFREGNPQTDANADRLDLGELLQDATKDTVLDYLHASGDDGEVILSVKSDGGINTDGSNADLSITLTGGTINFNGSGEDYINKMINNGQLDIT